MAGIECTGQALSVVRGWFKDDNIEDDELDADELDPKQAALVPRPARLGLGAKFLPHHKAAALLDPVERRLARQLGKAKDERLAQARDDGTSGKGAGKGTAGAGKGGADPAAEESGGGDSEDEDVRSAAHDRKRPQQAAAWQPAGGAKKKRKKKNKALLAIHG